MDPDVAFHRNASQDDSLKEEWILRLKGLLNDGFYGLSGRALEVTEVGKKIRKNRLFKRKARAIKV